MAIKKPVIVPIRPPLGGMNIRVPATDIELLQTPDAMNVRYYYGQLQSRYGFGVKYQGIRGTILGLNRLYTQDGLTNVIVAINETGVWQHEGVGAVGMPLFIYDGASVAALTAEAETAFISTALGEGTFTPSQINSASVYPAAGYAPILAVTNGADGVILIIFGSDGDPLVGEVLDAGAIGEEGARCVAFFANRLFIGGTTGSPAELLWSADSAYDDFTTTGWGSQLLGNEVEKIQNMVPLGEYLVVYKERSLYLARTTGRSDPAVMFNEIPSGGIGLAAPGSVADVLDNHVFLGWDDVYALTPSGVTSIGENVRDAIWGRSGDRGILRPYINRVFATTDIAHTEYWLLTPTGKIPEVTNLVTSGSMDVWSFEADTTLGDATISNVPESAFEYIRIGDHAYGSAIPSDKEVLILSIDQVAGEIELSENANITLTGTIIRCGDENDYTFLTLGSDTIESQAGGNFGGIFQRMTGAEDSSSTGLSVRIDLGLSESGVGRMYSAVIWLRVGAYTGTPSVVVGAYEYTDESVYLDAFFGPEYITNFEDYEDFVPLVFSGQITQETCRQLLVAVYILNSDIIIDVDAMQLVYMDNIDQQYWYRDLSTGYVAPGYLSQDLNPRLIPFIASRVGPWMPDTAWVYNWQHKSWACWEMPMLAALGDTISLVNDDTYISELRGTVAEAVWRFDDRIISNEAPTVVLAGADGQLYEVNPQYAYDWQDITDTPITSYWQSKDFTLDNPNQDKTVSRVTLFHEVSHVGLDVEVSVSTDSGATWIRQTIPIRVGNAETYADFFVTGEQARFEVRTQSPGFRLTGFSLKLIPRGESNAY
jgi:hypothetical protein